MNARHLTHATNSLLVAAVGMSAAHLMVPARADATHPVRIGFLTLLAAVGALAGWREHAALSDERGVRVARPALWMAAGAALALAVAALAWWVVHG